MVPFAERSRQRGLSFADIRASHSSSPRMLVMDIFLVLFLYHHYLRNEPVWED